MFIDVHHMDLPEDLISELSAQAAQQACLGRVCATGAGRDRAGPSPLRRGGCGRLLAKRGTGRIRRMSPTVRIMAGAARSANDGFALTMYVSIRTF